MNDTTRALDAHLPHQVGAQKDWKRAARELIYDLARAGGEFSAMDIQDKLHLTAEQMRGLPGLLSSAKQASLIEQTGHGRQHGAVNPADWIATGRTKGRPMHTYRGTAKFREVRVDAAQ